MTNPYAHAARQAKGARIVSLLLSHGITAVEMSNATVDDWRIAAYAAGVATPSQETRSMVLAALFRSEMPPMEAADFEAYQALERAESTLAAVRANGGRK